MKRSLASCLMVLLSTSAAARTMTGANGYTVHALPHDRLQAALRKYGRL